MRRAGLFLDDFKELAGPRANVSLELRAASDPAFAGFDFTMGDHPLGGQVFFPGQDSRARLIVHFRYGRTSGCGGLNNHGGRRTDGLCGCGCGGDLKSLTRRLHKGSDYRFAFRRRCQGEVLGPGGCCSATTSTGTARVNA